MNGMVAITGNTFPVKDQLKALGGKWNAEAKAWMVPSVKAEEARRLVAGSPRKLIRVGKFIDAGRSERREGGSWYRGGQSYFDNRGNFVLGADD